MSEPVDVLKNVSATLNGVDVFQIASKIIIAEDMTSTLPRCMIEVGRDSQYKIQEALAGNPININVQPQNGPALQCKYVVHSAKPSLHQTGKGLEGAILGVDEDYTKLIGERIKGGWKQTNTDSAIQDIHKKMGSNKKIEVSQGKQASFTSPNLMPQQAMIKAASLSRSGEDGHAFHYYTHKDGGTAYMKTLKDLTKQGPKATYNYKGTGAADPNSLGDPTVIFELHYEGSSVSNQKTTNAQGQRFNPQYNKFEKNDKAGQGLSTPGLGVKAADAKVAYPVVNSIEQEEKEKRHVDRDQQNLNKYSSKLKILVPIATNIHVGDVIQVNSGSATYFSDANPNNAASGKWLVTSLMHVIHPGGNEKTAGHTGRTLLHCIGKIS